MPDDASFPERALDLAPASFARRARGLGRRLFGNPRARLVAVAAALALIAAGAGVSHWLTVGRYLIATNNAYVRADISVISPRIEGYVRTVAAADNHAVKAGDILVEIEASDYQANLSRARASLARAQGELTAQNAARARAAADLSRYRPLAERGVFSPAGMDAIAAQAAQAGGGAAAAAADVAAARADVEAAELDLERTQIRAPIDGVVGDRQVQVGQYVRAGTPLMAVVPLRAVYVVANFKETQIARMHAGQAVTIEPDVDHGVHLRGVVESLAPASGAEFSIIPTDTATGNFTKIVQRVPVRIRIEPGQEGAALLRPGLSVSVKVDTRT